MGPVEYASAGFPRRGLTCPGCGGGLLYPGEGCACLGRGAGARPGGGRRAYGGGLTVAQAVAQLEERRRRWDADEEERYLRAYMDAKIRSQRPDPAACMRKLLRMKRRWLSEL